MALGGPLRGVVDAVNTGFVALTRLPGLGAVLRRYITTIGYTGRKSGREFSLPIGYQRSADTVTIRVGMPDRKTWWRNFLGAGAPMWIELDGARRTGHAVAARDERGRVTVTLRLDQPT